MAPTPGPALQTVILAGGRGTRIRTLAAGRAKALLPVAGKPFLDRQFELLTTGGVRDVLLCVGHLGDQIREHVGDGSRFGLRVEYSWDDPDLLLGTGGALVRAMPLLHDRFAVMYGDSYLPIDYRAFAAAFTLCGRPAMMSVYRNRGRWDASNVRVEGGRVAVYDKRAPADQVDCIDYGITAFERSVIEAEAARPVPFDLSEVLRRLVTEGSLAAWEAPVRFYEIGKPEGLADLERHLGGGGA